MELAKNYSAQDVEGKWYDYWMEHKLFRSVPDDREPYTIVIPPPNVTGVLHMGHMLNNTLQDVLIRRARMNGYNACWVPGTDHASIATEAKVVKMLKEKGINKWDITRDEFLKYAFEWKDEYGGKILNQLRKVGASCDWERTRFTMEPKLSKAVIQSFVKLYDKGLIYRGYRITNWDPEAKTVVSDEEVYHKEINSKLYHIRYQVEGSDEWVTIATTRPETIMGDTAVCFNPEDDRYKHLAGKKVIVPLINRAIPTITDDYVDVEFGTGALKVTPAHDANDYAIGQRHNLETIDILNEDGTLAEAAQIFVGEDRFKARKLVAAELEEKGHIVKIEEFTNNVGYSERTNSAIEPRLTRQWFVKMKDLGAPALENVMNDNITFFPEKYKNTYRHWLENIRDWCISRQLWWGQRIPVWYLDEETFFVAEDVDAALTLAKEKTGRDIKASDLKQDEDVVDTWFSSWLWPISVFEGFESEEEVGYYYPTNVLVTGWDIIFFWVARMIMAGYEFRGELPFKDVYFTGMVRDKQGRKMSKSLGNSPDALELLEKFGADGVRVGLLLCSPAGGDLLYDDKLCEQGRNFSNKIWNALRLVKGWEVTEGKNEDNTAAIEWMENKFNQVAQQVEKSYETYRISEVLNTLYKFVYDDFFGTYLEMVKPEYQKPIDQYSFDKTIDLFEKVMQIFHPIIPFITEEVYHSLRERKAGESIMYTNYAKDQKVDDGIVLEGEIAKDILNKVRLVRNKNSLKQRDPIQLYVKTAKPDNYKRFMNTIKRKAFLSSFEYTDTDIENAVSFIVNKDQFFVDTGVEINAESEMERLQKDLDYQKGFLLSVSKKLSNERFVNNAPAAVVENERKKQADAEKKIQILTESIAKLK